MEDVNARTQFTHVGIANDLAVGGKDFYKSNDFFVFHFRNSIFIDNQDIIIAIGSKRKFGFTVLIHCGKPENVLQIGQGLCKI